MPDDPAKRYLLDYCLEPWGTKFTKINRTIRPSIPSYAHVLQWFDKLFDLSNCALRRKISHWLGW